MIYDTFIFNEDFNALRIRLLELNEVVDFFIVAESSYTFTGEKKPLYLKENLERIKQFSDKVIVLSNTRKFRTRIPWTRDHKQRQIISKYLRRQKLSKNDLIIHSDCDEIPRKSVIAKIKSGKESVNVILEMDFYENFLNSYSGKWRRGRIVSGDNYKTINKMHLDSFLPGLIEAKRSKIPFVRVPVWATNRYFYLWKIPKYIKNYKPPKVIEDGGWHFNNLLTIDGIIRKIEASSHKEWNTPEFKDLVRRRHEAKKNLWTGVELNLVSIDESFPIHIRENLEEWKRFIA